MEEKKLKPCRFQRSGKEIGVYPSAAPNRPIIYLNTYQKDDGKVRQALSHVPDHTLVVISGLAWDHDMAPWDIPPISKNDTPCTGGADDYLELLTHEIIPRAEGLVEGTVLWRGLAGYSLYAIYRTDLFSRIASMSGSLWFPDFQEYIFSHEMKAVPDRLYLSLGDQECRTQNPYLKTVQERTEAIHAFCRQKGIETVYQLNPGNHFQNGIQRTAAGIEWILAD